MAPRPRLPPTYRFVVVDGAGPLAASVATLLRAGAVTRVDSGPWAADAADADLRADAGAIPHLVVLVAHGVLDPRAGEPWRRRSVPHLPVVSDGDRVVVGPLVSGGTRWPCLECLRLTRLDPGAVVTAYQRSSTPVADLVDRLDDALVAMGAGMAAMVARAGLTGGAVPGGVSVEVRTPWPRVDHRRWERHPDCPRHGPQEPHEVGAVRRDPAETRGWPQPHTARVTMTR